MTDAQWAVIEPLLPLRDPRRGGQPVRYPRRLVIDTVLYVLGAGCSWRRVPRDLAPWDVAYRWFRDWTADGTWQRVHDALREQVRAGDGRDPQPSAAVLGSQSVKSSEGGEAIGYDAGKRVRGASGTCWSTAAGCSCGAWCTRRRCRTAPAPSSS